MSEKGNLYSDKDRQTISDFAVVFDSDAGKRVLAWMEQAFWVKIIFARLVNDSPIALLLRFRIGQDLIHFSFPEIVAIAIFKAKNKSSNLSLT